MKIGEAFPSNWLKAADLQGRTIKAVISSVRMEDIGGDHKPVMYFQNKEKGVVLNKTNAMNIAFAFGDDTDNWSGAAVELYSERVMFQGKPVEGIRIRPLRNGSTPAPAAPAAAAKPAATGENFDEDIPF